MSKWGTVVVTLSVLLLPLAAQELPKAQKREHAEYYDVSYTKFKPGRDTEGFGYIYEHFVPVDKKIGRKVVTFDFHSGDWDHVVFFPLRDGLSQLSWSTSATEEKWWAAFAEQEGSAAKAQEIMQKFQDTIARERSEVAHRHLGILED